MPEPLPPPSLAGVREKKIEELSQHFANDDLSLEDLERRIESVYKATSLADLDLVTADLRPSAALVDPRSRGRTTPTLADPAHVTAPAGLELPRSRLVAFMSSTSRVGRWAVPRDLHMFAMMSDNRLDLTNAALPVGGIINVHITGIMAAVKLIVPPGLRVVNEMHSFMADVGSEADELPGEGLAPTGTPVIRLTGTAVMSEIKVLVRRREETG